MIKTWQQRCEEHPDHQGIVTEGMIRARMQEEIDELRQALEQPMKVQVRPTEFIKLIAGNENLIGTPIYWAEWPSEPLELRQALEQPEQEPVAWLEEVFNDDNKSLGYLAHEQPFENTTPVYTTPKKEWIGLTDEQIYEHEWWDEETAFAVNKELKEKNHG